MSEQQHKRLEQINAELKTFYKLDPLDFWEVIQALEDERDAIESERDAA
jgi:hypothetical protein